MQYPTLSSSTVRHVEFVAMAPGRILVVLILSTGRVEQRIVDLGAEVLDDTRLGDLRTRVNRWATGQRIAEASSALAGLVDQVPAEDRALTVAVTDSLIDAMSDHRRDERVVVSGTSHLARYGDTFETSVRPLLEAMEEHVVLLKLLGEANADGQITVRIGTEGPYSQFAATSVVSSGYGPTNDALASLGVVGPTRMDYPSTMATVRAVARYVSRLLDEA